MSPAGKDETNDLVPASKVTNKFGKTKQICNQKKFRAKLCGIITYPSVRLIILEIPVQSPLSPLDWKLHEES